MPEMKTRTDIENRILELLLQVGVALPALYQLQKNLFPEDEIKNILKVSGLPPKKIKLFSIAIESTLNLWKEMVKQDSILKNENNFLDISNESPSGFTPHSDSKSQESVDASAETMSAHAQLLTKERLLKKYNGTTKNLNNHKRKRE